MDIDLGKGRAVAWMKTGDQDRSRRAKRLIKTSIWVWSAMTPSRAALPSEPSLPTSAQYPARSSSKHLPTPTTMTSQWPPQRKTTFSLPLRSPTSSRQESPQIRVQLLTVLALNGLYMVSWTKSQSARGW